MVEARQFIDSQEDDEEYKNDVVNENEGNENGEEEDNQAQIPSSFYSQVPYSSQMMLNNARGGDEEEDQNLELFQMITLLHNEKMAPELLPFQFSLVEKVLRMIS